MLSEIWKDVVGYEGTYQVSSFGSVRRKTKFHSYDNNILTFRYNKGSRHRRVKLCNKGIKRFVFVHRLVAESFLGTRPEGYEVNHIDGNPENNNVTNLQYVTRSQNRIHACRVLRKGVLRTETIQKIREELEIGKSQSQISRDMGISQSVISKIHRKVHWSHNYVS